MSSKKISRMQPEAKRVRLDLNNAVFQRHLFNLTKDEQRSVLTTLSKISAMTWEQVYQDAGLKWEQIASRIGDQGKRLYSLRMGKGFRAVGFREGEWLRFQSLHPDHDSAYDR
ncbi:MAG TPA: hypothetical protein VGM86_09080 [Thermoanaerobaculia bacterium]